MKLKAFFLAVIVATTGVVSTAHASDWIENKVYQDPKFPSIAEQAEKILTQKGYTIKDIEADSRFGKPVLEIEAYKGYQEYDIVMSYPDLKIISERRDD